MRPFTYLLSLGLCCAAAPATIADHGPILQLLDGSEVRSRLIVSHHVSATERLAVERLTTATRAIFGFELPVSEARPGVSTDGAIVLGTPETNPLAARFSSLIEGLSPEGFVVQPVDDEAGRYVVLVAKSPVGLLHGASYLADFAMQSAGTGVVLQIAPVRRESPIRQRGTYNLVCWGLAPRYSRADWEKVIDAMADDGMNLIYFWLSGIFRSKLFPESFIYPETPLTSDDITQLIRHAHARGIDFYLGTGVFAWFGIDEIAKYHADFREVGLPYMSRTNPKARAAMKSYLHELHDAFPEADGMWLEIADEGDYACKDPECQKPIDQFGSKASGQVTPTFLKEFSAELWKKHPKSKLVWGIGYPEAHKWDVKYYDELRRNFTDPRYYFMEVRQNWELQDANGVLKPLRQLSANAMHWDQYYKLSLRDIGEHARRINEDGLAGYIVAFEPGFNTHSVFGRSIPYPVDVIPYRLTRFAYHEFTWDPTLTWPAFRKRLLDHFFGAEADPELVDLTLTLFEFMRTGPISGSFRELTQPVDGTAYAKVMKPRLAAIETRLNQMEPKLGQRAKSTGVPMLRRAIQDLRTGYSIQ